MSGRDTRHRLPVGSAWGEIDSPVGPLGVVVTPVGLLCLGFCSFASLAGAFATPDGSDAGPVPLLGHGLGAQVAQELREYFSGQRKNFTVPIDWSLTSGVQRSILATLRAEVPYGSTVGYGDLALLAGRTLGASRLVGTVMGGNPVAIVVPCHRVIAAGGAIGGFGGGLEAKRWLLTLEGALPPTLF
ncbi:MAG TPA: methylated-DNA--[protein]-cysteine S-methyltransferase [Actinocrinis sp.]|uniref:methylated-DNA--[protein]-cysteine S-methyltransferase n=1 Tax=Actinocrinis sp. TaxID=1920516 RepID=UPI002DDCAFB9|nr:methylated-DNA--[protein]-cysteine S-methyltransferase [Actinocrinis sp.]HEV2342497.1 methylated-DNA--[protein]-cysteine S-methyltransferase [Actinocrinis sp.]